MATLPRLATARPQRHALIAVGVVLLHVAALWALQSGLMRRAVEVFVPAQLLSEFIEPVAPKIEPPPVDPPPLPPKATSVKAVTPQPPVAAPAPVPVAVADPTPAPAAPSGSAAPQPVPPPIAAPVAVAEVAPPAPPPKVRVELPMVDADYTQNEEAFRPPPASVRLGEFGVVVLKVTVGANGFVSHAEVSKSSGFARLDNAALQGAKKVKFRPATRDGAPIEWTYLWPIKYSEPR